MIFIEKLFAAIETANAALTEADFDEYKEWKLRIREKMRVRIAGKSKFEKWDIVLKWYATTREYTRLLPVAKIFDENQCKNLQLKVDFNKRFWEYHEEDGPEWFWQSAVQANHDIEQSRLSQDALTIIKGACQPIFNDISAILLEEEIGIPKSVKDERK